jgi:hypothetical protein
MTNEYGYERQNRLEEKLGDNYCCEDFKYEIGFLLGMDYENNFTLELIDGSGYDCKKVINNCPWCGKKLTSASPQQH